MSLNAIVHLKYAGCDIFLKKSGARKKLVGSTEEAHFFSNFLNKTISVNILCNKCRLSTYRIKKKPDRLLVCETDLQVEFTTDPTFQIAVKSKKDVTNIEYIQIPLQRTVSTHNYCCICSSRKDLIVIPEEARIQSYLKRKIYIPVGNRCCKSHVIKNRLFEEDLSLLKVHSNTSSVAELSKVMKTLTVN